VFGHGSSTEPFKFTFPRGGGAVGYAACFPDKNLLGVDESKRLRGQLPAGLQCLWNLPPGGLIRDRVDSDQGEGIMPFDGKALLSALERSIGAKAKELCDLGCKEVAVRYYLSAKQDDKAVPPQPADVTIPCSLCVQE
jgi:hypothetical protein